MSDHPELCTSLHLKVFGHPIPTELLEVPSTSKKPRKPKVTRSRPSTDALPPLRRYSSSSMSQPPIPVPPRAVSRAPSDTSSRASSTMRRSVSKTSDSLPVDYQRSRSRSIDPQPVKDATYGDQFPKQARKFGRAPSGADLFRGRQVGLIRRTSSVVARKGEVKASSEVHRQESQSQPGLLGRKLSDKSKAKEGKSDEMSRGYGFAASAKLPFRRLA